MMRIALVSPYDFAYPGGVNTHIVYLQKFLLQAGHRVTIVAPSSKRVSNPDLVVMGRPVPFPSNGSTARISLSPFLITQVKNFLDGKAFDIIHVHEPFCPGPGPLFLSFSKAINVATFHAFYSRSHNYRFWSPLLNEWFRRLHGRIAVSPAALSFISRYFPGDYSLIPNGIDLEHFSNGSQPLPEFRDGKHNILFVGRLEKRKGLKHLLAAFHQLKEELPDTRLLVVGPGRLSWRLRWFLRRHEIKDVHFLGPVPYAQLPSYYRSAHVFCSPSKGKESFGIVLLEAMASRLPVVASSIEGYSYLVRDGQEGFLVKPGDEEGLARALARLLKDEALRQEMGARGQERAREFGWPKVAQQVLALYESLLSRAP